MIRAIIADDEKATYRIIRHFIDEYGMPVEIIASADNGKDTFDLINRLHPHLVFIDIQMPLLTGLEVIEEIRKSGDRQTRFIIITGYRLFEYAQSALRLGAEDILLKPVDGKQLKASIEKAIGFPLTNNALINQVLAYLDKNYGENITLKRTAEHFFVSHNHLARLFKKYTDKTYNEYLNRLRIEKAKTLLVQSEISIKEVAFNVGYANLNNFYTQFKQHSHMTPKAFATSASIQRD